MLSNEKKNIMFGDEVNTLFTNYGKGYWSKKAQKYVPSTKPLMNVDVPWVYNSVLSERAKPQTLELRQMMTMAMVTDQ